MKSLKKLIIGLTLTSTIFATSAFAQVESDRFYSNGYNSTARTIRTDTEDFIDVRYFDKIDLNKVFLTTNLTKSGFNVGAATKVNDYYLAGLYSGGFWEKLYGNNSKTKSTLIDEANKSTTTTDKQDLQNTNYNASAGKFDSNINRIIFMVGFPNKMGLKLDSYLKFNSNTTNNNTKTNVDFENGANDTSTNTPSSTDSVGTTKNIDNEYEFNLVWSSYDISKEKFNITPWARVGVDMYDVRTVTDNKSVNKVSVPQDSSLNEDNVTTYNKVTYGNTHRPQLNINLGTDIDFKNNSKFHQLLILDYGLSANLYGKTVSTEKTVYTDNLNKDNNTSDETVVTRDGKMDFTNSITGTYKFDIKPIEKLTLAGRVGLKTSVRAYADGKTTTTVTYIDKDGKDVTVGGQKTMINGEAVPVMYPVTKFENENYNVDTTFTPNFGIGLKYAVKPNFVLNLGYNGTIPNIEIKSNTITNDTIVTKDANGTTEKPHSDKTTNVTTTTGNYSSSLSTGFTWSMGDCCALDVAINITRTPSFDKVWNAGWNLGFTFKK